MAQRIELDIAPRTVMGKANKRLRKAGIIPANIYGHKEAPQPVQVEALALERLRREHGARNVLSLRLPNGPTQTALISHVQRDARNGTILHVDFARVSLRERVEVKIPLRFVGEARGVKMQGGVLLPLLDTLSVECRASDLVEFIEVDISSLTDIDSALRAGDIKLPNNYKLVTDPGEPVIKVNAPRVEAATTVNKTATEETAPATETTE
jgi:large subunit ribosomal protein L25